MNLRIPLRYASALLLVTALLLATFNVSPKGSAQRSEPSGSQLALAPIRSSLARNSSVVKEKIVGSYGNLPLSFEANEGQTDSAVKFLSRGPGYTLFLTQTEAALALARPQAKPELTAGTRRSRDYPREKVVHSALLVKLVGANPKAHMEGSGRLPGNSSYFIGNDPAKWRTGIPNFREVRYESLYPGIDLTYYGNQGQLECDFVVAPGADPSAIRLAFSGAQDLRVDDAGDLVARFGSEEFRLRKPFLYQEQNGTRQQIAGGYVLQGARSVGFQVESYDTRLPLVVDPQLSYSTYLGGNGSDVGYAIAADAAGNVYVAGETGSTNFPTTTGAFQTTNGGNDGCFVAKLNAVGTALTYSTYLGGSSYDTCFGIAVDAGGNAYLTGRTYSSDFPTTAGAYQTAFGGGSYDGFVTKLNPTGTALVYSTYLGGSNDDFGQIIAVDSSGNSYVTGVTYSSNFPITPGSFQTILHGADNAFITKLNPTGTALVYSTFLGGTGDNGGLGIAVDPTGNAYVTGYTRTTDFPTTPGAFQMTNGGTNGAFVTKLNPTGSALVYSTFLGGSNDDLGFGIAIDTAGNAYVTGFTRSTDFPTTTGAYQTVYAGGLDDGFVTELNPTGTALVYSTFLGGSGDDEPCCIVLDAANNAYVTGFTASTNFPTTTGAFQTTYGGGSSDSFVTVLNPTGTALVYSTYLGGNNSDGANNSSALALDGAGNTYVTGLTYSTNFPTTSGAFQTALAGSENAYISKISLSGPTAPAVTLPASLTFGMSEVGNALSPQNVTLTNSGTAALTINSISVTGANSGDFSSTNNCGNSVAAGANCNISVTFTPSGAGNRTASLSVSDNAAGSPQTVALSGTGMDYSISATPATFKVNAGATATYTVTVAPLAGAPMDTVALSASGAPSGSTATFTPQGVTPNNSSATSTLTIQAPVAASAPKWTLPRLGGPGMNNLLVFALLLVLLWLMLLNIVRKQTLENQGRRRSQFALTGVLFAVLMGLVSGCNGGFPLPAPAGTNYTVTISGNTEGSLRHSTTVTLTVVP